MAKRTNFKVDYHPDFGDFGTSRAFTKIREEYNLVALVSSKSKTTLLTAMRDPVEVEELEKRLSRIGIKSLEIS